MTDCEHAQTVQVFFDIFKCSTCGELITNDDETIDHTRYERIRRGREIRRDRAIRRNRRPNR